MSKQHLQSNFTLVPKIINGTIAGCLGVSTIFPMDLVKTRLQNQEIGPNGERQYKSIADCFVQTYRRERFSGMYRGLGVNLVWVGPEKSFKMAVNDYLRFLLTKDGDITLFNQCVAGAGTGALQVIITNPMELLKIQLQLAGQKQEAAGQKKTAIMLTKEVLQANGLLGLYKGVGPCSLRDIGFSLLYFPFMYVLNDLGPRRDDNSGEAKAWWSLLAGLIAASASAFAVTPFDVIKTRLQASDKDATKRYKGIMDCFSKTLAHEGPLAFFKGGLCRMLVLAPMYGVMQMMYFFGLGEKICEFFKG